MQDKPILSLDEKIQKLITKYSEIKEKYVALLNEKNEFIKNDKELKQLYSQNKEKIEDMEKSISQQKDEIEFLRNENRSLRKQLEKYESNTKDALTKLDDVLNQIHEL